MRADALRPLYLTLPEVVAAVFPSRPTGDRKRALAEALSDGRLVEVPRPLWSQDEVQDFVAAAGFPRRPVRNRARFCRMGTGDAGGEPRD